MRAPVALVLLPTLLSAPAYGDVVREDLAVTSDGLSLYVRLVADDTAEHQLGPVLLLHGARVGGVASFDVDVPGFSLAEDLAAAGHSVYVADLRGFGRSEFPASMEGNRFAAPPAVRTEDAVVDVKAVLDAIAARHTDAPIGAVGWATGSHWLAATEATHPGSFDRLVFFNSVYGGEGEWRLTENFAIEGEPAAFDYERFGAYRTSDADSLVGRWTEAEAISDAFVERYVALAMEGDETAGERTPPSFRHPSGPIADTLLAVHDRPLYDAAAIRSRVLILRSGNDFWSRPVDVATLRDDLTGAASVTVHELADQSHYVHLEPGEGRNAFLAIVTDFLADGELAARSADR